MSSSTMLRGDLMALIVSGGHAFRMGPPAGPAAETLDIRTAGPPELRRLDACADLRGGSASGKVVRAILYAEDTALARGIAQRVEENPSWELIALCTTPADLNFVLDRVTVDVLLYQPRF
jgi:hypothetical protein